MEKNFTIWDSNKVLTNTEEYLLKRANLPKYQWIEDRLIPMNGDEEAFSELFDIRNNINQFVRSEKNNLVICSNYVGNGKTSWSVKLMLTYIEKNAHRLDFTDVNELDRVFDIALFCQTVPFLVKMKQFGNNLNTMEMYSRLEKSELVVLDDVGVLASMSQYDYNILYSIVETRLFAGLPTIYTTNATSQEELVSSTGPRLANRIWATSKIIKLNGCGFRGVE